MDVQTEPELSSYPQPTSTPTDTNQPLQPGLILPPSNSGKSICLKGTTLIFGFLAVVLTLTALNLATYYQSVCLASNQDQETSSGTEIHCTEQTPFSYDKCNWRYEHREEVYKSPAYNQEFHKEIESCPSKWLVEPQVYILTITWVFSAIVLIGTCLKTGITPDAKMSKIDVYCMIAVGGIFLLCALCLLVFFSLVVSSDYWCSAHPFYFGYGWYYETHVIFSHVRSSEEDSSGSDLRAFKENGKYAVKTCGEANNLIYQPWLIFAGMIMAVTAGIMALISACMLKSSKVRQGFQGNRTMPGSYRSAAYAQVQMGMGSQYQYQQPQMMMMNQQQQFGYSAYQNPYQPQMQQMMPQQQQYGQVGNPSWQAMQQQPSPP